MAYTIEVNGAKQTVDAEMIAIIESLVPRSAALSSPSSLWTVVVCLERRGCGRAPRMAGLPRAGLDWVGAG